MKRAMSMLFLTAVCLLPMQLLAQQSPDSAQSNQPGALDSALGSAEADAASVPPRQLTRRVAVVALGEGSKSGSVMQTLLTLLDDDGFEVLEEERLRRLTDTSLVPDTPPEISRQFVGLSTRIGEGIEKFFYKGNDAALDRLTPVFNLGMAYPEVLARRPDFARQIFEAGLVMIRAYRNLKRHDDARRLARGLVEAFPGFDARSNSVPPEVVALLSNQREELAASGTKLQIEMVRGEGCQALVNGTSVGASPFAVSAETKYFVTMECGGGAAPLWRVQPVKSVTTRVPIATRHPLDYVMPNGGFRHRKSAEAYLQMVSFWADVPRVLGVADAEDADASDSVILVHLEADGRAGWSDRADKKTVSRMLVRVMNDYDGRPAKPEGQSWPQGSSESTDWLSWSLIGTGVLAAGAGTYGLFAAGARAKELRCSPDVNSGATEAECAGVREIYFANAREFEQASNQVDTVNLISGLGLAAGLSLVGWGVYRLSTHEPASTPRLSWSVGFSPRSAHLGARVSF
jgi:hypothetical protein